MEPVHDVVWFAGEAAHETLWGTVGGAWESGERAADAILHRLGGQKEQAPAEAETTGPKRKPEAKRSSPERRRLEATPRIMRY
jgi:hypothetical protein